MSASVEVLSSARATKKCSLSIRREANDLIHTKLTATLRRPAACPERVGVPRAARRRPRAPLHTSALARVTADVVPACRTARAPRLPTTDRRNLSDESAWGQAHCTFYIKVARTYTRIRTRTKPLVAVVAAVAQRGPPGDRHAPAIDAATPCTLPNERLPDHPTRSLRFAFAFALSINILIAHPRSQRS